MATKRFEYQHKDIPYLKKNMCFRMIFVMSFLFIFIWQLFNIIHYNLNKELTDIMLIIGGVNLFFCVMYILVALLYYFRCLRTIKEIKKDGKSVKLISLMSVNKKDSYIKMYNFISKIIAIVMLLVLVSALTYTILELIYYSTISYYLPVIFTLTFSGFNAVLHMNFEIKLMENVNEYHNMY